MLGNRILGYKVIGNDDDLKSSFPSVNLAFVKNYVNYIKYDYNFIIYN